MHGEGYIPVRERRQCGLGDDVFTVFQDLARESPQEESQGLLLGILVRKSDDDHGRYPFNKLATAYLIWALGRFGWVPNRAR
jgi:hypothetical protein